MTKEMMKKAHEMTKEIKATYPEVDYKTQLGLCIACLLEENKEVEEMKGTDNQVAWAKDIQKELVEKVMAYKDNFNNATWNKRNYLINFKEEILKGETKLNGAQAAEKLNKILDEVIENIKNETSAKKLINIKTSLKVADFSISDDVIRKFL